MVKLEESIFPSQRTSRAHATRLLILLWVVSSLPATAALDVSNPVGFFTNVAARLLKSDLQLDLNHIEVYPSNRYTPAVNRLLQVTANLYDSTTNRSETAYPYLPSVFRPLFRRNAQGAVWIAAYREVTNSDVAMIDPIDLGNSSDSWTNIPPTGAAFDPDDTREPMVCGVPLIIGAKKGYPNFNALGAETAITVSRTLQFHRAAPFQPVSQTNQIYSLSISNSLGVQAWNSYVNPFPRALTLTAFGKITLTLSNEFGIVIGPDNLPLKKTFSFEALTNIPAGAWAGFKSQSAKPSFLLPIIATNEFLPRSLYLQDGTAEGSRFTNALMIWDPTNTFRIPKWKLNTKIRLRLAVVDTVANRIVDYVNLIQENDLPDLNEALLGSFSDCGYIYGNGDPNPGSFWCTDRLGASDGQLSAPAYGILNQIDIAAGVIQVSDSFWRSYNVIASDKNASIEKFQIQFYDLTTNLSFEPSFNPKRTIYQNFNWTANDPLIHRTLADLADAFAPPNDISWDSNSQSPIRRLASLNPLPVHFRPWGGNPNNPADTSPSMQYNPAIKDPLIRRSDDWNFPSGEPLTFATLGRIHRGTPWQTIYLKALDTDANTWSLWSGNLDSADAWSARPISDRQLASLLDQLLDKDPRPRLSINISEANAWLEVLNGLPVLTNSFPESELTISSNSNQAAVIVDAFSQTRALQPFGYFQSLGQILSIPELSSASPFLNTNNWNYNSPSDAALEKIPSQLLPLLRADSIGSAVMIPGQAALRFTGYDNYPYAVEASTNLQNWTALSTNLPSNGFFITTNSPGSAAQFFRSRLLNQ